MRSLSLFAVRSHKRIPTKCRIYRCLKFCNPAPLLPLARLPLQPELVSNDGNELRVGRLAFVVLNGVAEQIVDSFQAASVPRNFDGMADGTLHAAWCGVVSLGDGRVQFFGDGALIYR